MAVADMITQDGQIQWRGLLMGEGTPFVGVVMDGWADLPDVDNASANKPAGHGSWPGSLMTAKRTVQWDFSILPDFPTDFPRLLRELRAATAIHQDETWMAVQLGGATRMIRGRITKRSLPADTMFTRGEPKGTLVWECTDARWYDIDQRVAVVGLPQPDSGLDWGGDFVSEEGLDEPLDFGATGRSGDATVVNAGDAPLHPIVEFRGPCVRPTLVKPSTGARLEYDLTLAPDDLLVVDCASGTVVLNGTASRLHTVTGRSTPEQAFVLNDGVTVLSFRAADTQMDMSAASVKIKWNSAYW